MIVPPDCPECESYDVTYEGVDLSNGALMFECQTCYFEWEEDDGDS